MKALKLLDGVISSEVHNFLKCEIKLSSRKPKGCRYDAAFKGWALNLYHISGKSYRFLAKLFHLPSKRSLTRMVSRFASETGFSVKSLDVVKEQIDQKDQELPIRVAPKLTDTHLNLNGFLKMKVKLASKVFRHSVAAVESKRVPTKRRQPGLEDNGIGESSGLPATSALVLMGDTKSLRGSGTYSLPVPGSAALYNSIGPLLQISNLKKINTDQQKDILENQKEIIQLNGSIRRYQQKESFLELQFALVKQLKKQAEHEKNLAIHRMQGEKEKWRNIYRQQAYIDSESYQMIKEETVISKKLAKKEAVVAVEERETGNDKADKLQVQRLKQERLSTIAKNNVQVKIRRRSTKAMSGYEADTDSEVESLVLLQDETSSSTKSTKSDACCKCEKESELTLSDSSASDIDYDADDEQEEKFDSSAKEERDFSESTWTCDSERSPFNVGWRQMQKEKLKRKRILDNNAANKKKDDRI
eukprot:gene17042-8551_t